MAWLNNDGLYIKFGREEGVAGTTGAYEDYVGGSIVVETVFDLTSLNTSTPTILDDNYRFGAGWRVQRVALEVVTAATSGGAATLDIGLIRSDRSTQEDNDGFAAAVALSTINAAGKTQELTVGSTGVGALVGTDLATTAKGAYLVAKAGTAAFTAGRVKVRVFLSKLG